MEEQEYNIQDEIREAMLNDYEEDFDDMGD